MKEKQHYFYIAGLVLLVVAVAFLLWQNMKLKKSQNILLDRIQKTDFSAQGRIADPYIIGPVKNTITKNAREIQQCYNAYIDRKPAKTDGFVRVDWRIDTRGKTIKPEIVFSELADQALETCLTDKIASWNFLPPETEKYISHKFVFKKR